MKLFQTISSIPGSTKALVTLYDAVLGGLCMFIAIRWRYAFEEKGIPSNIDENAALVFIAVVAIIWVFTKLNKAIWRFTSLDDIKNLLEGVTLASIVTPVVLFLFFSRAQDFPRSAPFIAGAIFFLALTMSRMVVLFIRNGDVRAAFRGQISDNPGAILVGTASSLHNYLRDMNRKLDGPGFNIIGLIDIDGISTGRSIRSFPVLGNLDDIKPLYEQIKRREGTPPTLIVSDIKTGRKESANLVKLSAELGAPLVRVNHGHNDPLTPFEAADLIGRKVKSLDIAPVKRFISGKRVMITGAGGTIGSELTRQIAGLSPARLSLVDCSEFLLYETDRKLRRDYSQENLDWFAHIGDVRNISRLKEIFDEEKPDIILHAAALKHVHLGESNPVETLRTNVVGTRNVIDCSIKYGAESFTLISTDKAVEPSNIMGASKRVAELLTLTEDVKKADISTCAVRFGNVLASNGSVVPLFEEQIANGGPVTVTHPDVKRFFMTTEEAASLVLQASALNSTKRTDRSPIYVLEMGEPVKIAHLARQLIRLRGKVPERDIMIEYTNLRPGEKLNESLKSRSENLESTYVKGISLISVPPPDAESIKRRTNRLIAKLVDRDLDGIRIELESLITGFNANARLSNKEIPLQSAKIIPLNESQQRK